jgi:hypothetical protein
VDAEGIRMRDTVARPPARSYLGCAMQAQLSVIATVRRALVVLASNLHIFLVLAILLAVPSVAVTDWLTEVLYDFYLNWMIPRDMAVDKQIASILCMGVADIVVVPLDLVLKTLVIAAVVRVFAVARDGLRPGLGDAISYAFSSFGRLFKPYAIAQLLIFVGALVYIPGILLGLFWAFVAPVVLFNPGVESPLRRSTRLTVGRRGRIFRIYLLFFPFWGPLALVGPLWLPSQHFTVSWVAWSGNALLWFVIMMAVLQLYFERMEQLQALLDASEAEPGPGADADQPLQAKT